MKLGGAYYDEATQFPEDFDKASLDVYFIGPKANLRGVGLSKSNLSGVDLSAEIGCLCNDCDLGMYLINIEV